MISIKRMDDMHHINGKSINAFLGFKSIEGEL
jgi:hypothetical protein